MGNETRLYVCALGRRWYYFGVLAFIAAVFAIRFGDFRRRCIERFDIDGYRAALAFMAIIYGLFVVCGIVLIVKAARV